MPKMPTMKREDSLRVMSAKRQTQAIRAVMNPQNFEKFSENDLAVQMKALGITPQKGGHKGGGFKNVVEGAIKRHIKPAWVKIKQGGYNSSQYVKNIATNYMNKIKTLATEAGLSGPNAQQNLQSILYGLAVLAAAWNLGLIQAIPDLTLYLIDILNSIAKLTVTLPMDPMIQNAVFKIAGGLALYRYRNVVIGAYGVISSTAAPIFTAIYARGDEAFQHAFPNFGQNVAAGGAIQLQQLRARIIGELGAAQGQLQAAMVSMQPGIAAIASVGEAWRNYVNESIKTFIDGLAQAQNDMEAIKAYYRFLENVGQNAQAEGVVISPGEDITAIADLTASSIPPSIQLHELSDNPENTPENITNNIITGAIAMGGLVSDETGIGPDEAAALLLSLGNPGNTNGNSNVGVALSVEQTDNVNPHAAAAAAAKNIIRTADLGGGKARRRRHRKTAKKSHKKKHTKKHKKKTTKTKKGKKSKRHTKRRS